jgi:transglutaminase-like putative cysteine protease
MHPSHIPSVLTRLVRFCGIMWILFIVAAAHSLPNQSRTFEFTYTVMLPVPDRATELLRVWVPLPLSESGVQDVSDLKITAPGDYRVTEDRIFKNRMIYFECVTPNEPTQISWTATVTRNIDAGQGDGSLNDRYLSPNRLIPIDGSAKTMAEALGSNDPSLPVEDRAKLIFDDVLGNMEYNKKVAGYGLGDFDRSVVVCKGNCTDFHARFTGVGRASMIPVRFTMGIPLKSGATSYNSYHCWAHWHDGRRWQPVDISEADKIVSDDPEKASWYFGHLGTDRIGLTYGRDLILDPPQTGGELNYFVFPYAEADGEALSLDKSMWLFTWRDIR